MANTIGVQTVFTHEARERLREAVNLGSVADFSDLSGDQRCIPADFLQSLITGEDDSIGGLCRPLRIRGADIIGTFRSPPRTAGQKAVSVQFWRCSFDQPVDLSGANFLVLRFVDCRLPAFIGASLRLSADLDLSGSKFSGVRDYESELSDIGQCAVHLNNARIGGKLDLSSTSESRFTAEGAVRLDGARVDGDVSVSGALLDGCGEAAFSARSATLGSNLIFKPAAGHRFEAIGEVALVAAQITGDLNTQSARLTNPEGRALHCEDLRVESVILTALDGHPPFEARGRLNFLTAIIGGSFFLRNARVAPGPDNPGMLMRGGPIALNLQQARISNALALDNIGALGGGDASLDEPPTPVEGWFLLTGAQLTSLFDNVKTGWPAHGFLDLDGAVYERIRHLGGDELVAKRIAWLRRQFPGGRPDAVTYRPQPYEQLARVLRQHGLAREANSIAVEKIRMRLAARVDGFWTRLFPNLLMLVSQHGYSTSRAIMSFLVFVLIGSAMYATALFGFQQPFLPVEHDPSPVTYRMAFDLAGVSMAEGCPGLDVFHFALDSALPVIDLSQDLRCRFTPEGPLRQLWLLLHSFFVIAGAALSAIVILTLTGLLRQD